MKKLALGAALLAAPLLNADIIVAFDESLDVFDQQTSSPTETFGLVSGEANPFGTGNAIRVTDLDGAGTNGVKLVAHNITTPVAGPVQVRFQLYGLDFGGGANSDSFKIRLGNSEKSISTQSNAAVSLEPRMDGDLVVKSGSGDYKGGAGFLDLNTAYTIDILANFDPASSTTYTFGDQTDRALNAQNYDVYVNGVLLNTSGSEAFQGANFTSETGFSAIGFMTDSNRIGGDWIIDNVYIGYGADFATQLVPEPSTYAAMLGLGVLGYAFHRRRRAAATGLAASE